MIVTGGHSQFFQQPYKFQCRQVWLNKLCRRVSLLKFSSKALRMSMESKDKAVVCVLAPLTPQKAPCKRPIAHESIGGKVGKARLGRSNAFVIRKVGAAQSRVGPTEGTDKERGSYGKSYEELGRYGVDETDYDFVNIQSGRSLRQSTQMAKELMTSPSGRPKNNSDPLPKIPAVANEAEETDAEGNDWCSYLLLSADMRRTYVGVSSDVSRRLRQHNGELAGGAKAARGGRPWRLICTVWGFGSRSEACQFEWRWKTFSKSAIGKEKAVSKESLPPLTDVAETQVIKRRWAALKEAQGAWDQWRNLRVEWHSED